jgi:16S rRNA (cytosine967-C5)-methyltransferase
MTKTERSINHHHKTRLMQALKILNSYDTTKPLNFFLKNFYQSNRNMGSNDRRQLSTIIYQYFRLGKNFSDLDRTQKICISTLLCNAERNPITDFILSESIYFGPEQIELSLDDKINLVENFYPHFKLQNIFPFTRYLSPFEDADLFIKSHFIQPRVWIRIRSDKRQEVIDELKSNKFIYETGFGSELCLSFIKHYPLHELESFDKNYFEIQDGGSQMTGNFFKPNPNEVWWDACAGSGGKSLMLLDKEPSVSLFLTDNRDTIIKNLMARFERAKITNFKTLVTDLTKPRPVDIPFEFFDGIILDTPCSGSGTWAATPEMLSSFDIDSIAVHHKIQTTIAQHVLPYLKVGKPIIYITCSVYKQENEDVVKFLCDNFNMTLESQQIIEGFRYGASTFFVARMIKN